MRGTLLFGIALAAAGCTVGEVSDGGDASLDAGVDRPDVAPFDAGSYDAGDPFEMDGSCGRAVIESTRLPGSLLFLFDRSGSMDAPPVSGGGGPTRWEIAGGAIMSVLDTMPDEANVGMLLFPVVTQGMCGAMIAADVPQVPVAPLSTSRAMIAAQLTPRPDGPATPIFTALRSGWSHLDMLGARGERGVVLVTDGRENCEAAMRDAVLAEAATAFTDDGHLTFVVGLTQSNSDLSTLAFNGGTPRNPTCLPDCTTPACIVDGDMPCPHNGARCATFPDGEGGQVTGFCGCTGPTDCPTPMTCEPDAMGMGMVCAGAPNCCHWNAAQSSFETDFRAALDAIVERVVNPCLFDLPRGADPAMFDPNQVNVRITPEGGSPATIPRGDDPSVDSWDYTSADQDTIEITGPICEQLRNGGTVEIVLGCPTILI